MKSAKGVSLATVRSLWAKYNEEVFNSSLSEPIFRITRGRNYWAKFVYLESSPTKIAIYVSGFKHRGSDVGHLRDSILHEMIHHWQHENGHKYNEHDETFTQWLPVIEERTGIKLQESWIDCEG